MRVGLTGSGRAWRQGLLAGTALLALSWPAFAQTAEVAQSAATTEMLPPVAVEGKTISPTATIGNLPEPYAGGQVSRGTRLGVLGNQDMMDTPFNITGYTEETIRNQQATTIAEVLANDPGVRMGYGFGNFSERFVIRGFPVDADDISVDGLYGLAPRQIVEMQAFERVEVLKGAGAFLNGVPPGGTGIGGGINLVPKRAGDDPLTRVTLGYQTDSRVSGAVDYSRRFGLNKEFGVRLNGLVRNGDTAVDHETRNTWMGAASFDARGERARLTVDVGSQRQRVNEGRPVVNLLGTGVPSAPSARTNYAADWSYSQLTDTYGMVRGEYDLSPNFTAYAALGMRALREDGVYGSPTVDGAGIGTMRRLWVPREDRAQTGQAGVNGQFLTGAVSHKTNMGASVLYTENHNSFNFGAPGSPININNPGTVAYPPTVLFGSEGDTSNLPKVSDVHNSSIFFSDTLGMFDDRLQLVLGGRYQRIRVGNYNRVTSAQDQTFDDSALTPVVGILFKVMPTLSLYANRVEGLAQGPTAPITSTTPGKIFAPYKSAQYEVGAKVDFGNVGASLAVFQTKQPQGVSRIIGGLEVFNVDGDQRNRGVELMGYGEPIRGVRVIGGFTYLDTEQLNTLTPGKEAVGVPSLQANLGAEWDLPFLAGVTVGGRVVHTASQYADAANTLQIPSWTRLDLSARYATEIQNRPTVFRLNVENVTNNGYWASATGGYLTQGNPLTAKLSVSTDF